MFPIGHTRAVLPPILPIDRLHTIPPPQLCVQARELVLGVLKAGVNMIDSSHWYGQGRSERMLGYALKGVPRSAYYINTKIGRYDKDPMRMFDFSYEKTYQAGLDSLRRLGLEQIDSLQIHDPEFAPSIEVVVDECIPALQKLKAEGKIRLIGMTGYPLELQQEKNEKTRKKAKRTTPSIDHMIIPRIAPPHHHSLGCPHIHLHLTIALSQLPPHNYPLTITPSQLPPHNCPLTITPSQLPPHNCTLTIAPSQLHALKGTLPIARSQVHSHNCTLTIARSQVHSPNCTLTAALLHCVFRNSSPRLGRESWTPRSPTAIIASPTPRSPPRASSTSARSGASG